MVKLAGGTGRRVWESLTVTWNVNEPATAGVPVMFPEETSVNPQANCACRRQVYAAFSGGG